MTHADVAQGASVMLLNADARLPISERSSSPTHSQTQSDSCQTASDDTGPAFGPWLLLKGQLHVEDGNSVWNAETDSERHHCQLADTPSNLQSSAVPKCSESLQSTRSVSRSKIPAALAKQDTAQDAARGGENSMGLGAPGQQSDVARQQNAEGQRHCAPGQDFTPGRQSEISGQQTAPGQQSHGPGQALHSVGQHSTPGQVLHDLGQHCTPGRQHAPAAGTSWQTMRRQSNSSSNRNEKGDISFANPIMVDNLLRVQAGDRQSDAARGQSDRQTPHAAAMTVFTNPLGLGASDGNDISEKDDNQFDRRESPRSHSDSQSAGAASLSAPAVLPARVLAQLCSASSRLLRSSKAAASYACPEATGAGLTAREPCLTASTVCIMMQVAS